MAAEGKRNFEKNGLATQGFFIALGNLQPLLFTHCLVLADGDEDFAWEILQEANLWLCKHAGEYSPERGAMRTWANAVAANTAKKLSLRKKRASLRSPFSQEEKERLLASIATRDESGENRLPALRHCLAKLSRRDRAFIWRHYSQKKSLVEIASEDGSGISAAKMRMHRLRRSLAECIRGVLCKIGQNPAADELLADVPFEDEWEVHALLLFEAHERRSVAKTKRRFFLPPLALCAVAGSVFVLTRNSAQTTIPRQEPVLQVAQKEQEREPMQTIKTAAVAALALSAANAAIMMNARDNYNESSLVSGAHWDEDGHPAPHSGADYHDIGYLMRSPEGNPGSPVVFGGDSLSLENAVLAFKTVGQPVVIQDFRMLANSGLENSLNGTVTLQGRLTVLADASAPAFISMIDGRTVAIESDLYGSADAVFMVTNAVGNSFSYPSYARLSGSLANYEGKFIADGANCWLAANSTDRFGSGLTLRNHGGFAGISSSVIGNPACPVTVDGDGSVTWYSVASGKSYALFCGNGGRLEGSGVLHVYAKDGSIAFGDWSTDGGVSLHIESGTARFYGGWTNSHVRVVAKSNSIVACNTTVMGPLELTGQSSLQPGSWANDVSTLRLPSLAVSGGAFLRYTVNASAASDFIAVDGRIEKNTASGKIPILLEDTGLASSAYNGTWKLLCAENLGDDLGAEDFSLNFHPNIGALYQDTFDGRFEILRENGTNFLTLVRSTLPWARMTAGDSGGQSSFSTAGNWNTKAAPDMSHYYMTYGNLMRIYASTEFAGAALHVVNASGIAICGADATCDNLHFWSGTSLGPTYDLPSRNTIRGKMYVHTSQESPMLCWNTAASSRGRVMEIASDISGDGCIRFTDGGTPFDKGEQGYEITGENSAYKGGIALDSLVYVDLASPLGTSWRIATNATLRVSKSFDFAGPVELDESATIQVLDGQTLALTGVVSGSGTLTKKGAGKLTLRSSNSYSGTIVLEEGVLAVADENAVPGKLTSVSGGVLSIESVLGLKCSQAPTGVFSLDLPVLDGSRSEVPVFTIAGAESFDVSAVNVVSSGLAKNYKVELRTRSVEGGLQVYARGTVKGTVIMLLGN